MLLVTFHGGSGSPGINNIHAYDTPADGTSREPEALGASTHGTLSELRAMVLANGLLYVANGAKSESTVLAYDVPSSGTSFTYAATLIGPDLRARRNTSKPRSPIRSASLSTATIASSLTRTPTSSARSTSPAREQRATWSTARPNT